MDRIGFRTSPNGKRKILRVGQYPGIHNLGLNSRVSILQPTQRIPTLGPPPPKPNGDDAARPPSGLHCTSKCHVSESCTVASSSQGHRGHAQECRLSTDRPIDCSRAFSTARYTQDGYSAIQEYSHFPMENQNVRMWQIGITRACRGGQQRGRVEVAKIVYNVIL